MWNILIKRREGCSMRSYEDVIKEAIGFFAGKNTEEKATDIPVEARCKTFLNDNRTFLDWLKFEGTDYLQDYSALETLVKRLQTEGYKVELPTQDKFDTIASRRKNSINNF